MEPSGIHYLPLTLPFYAALGVVFALLPTLIQRHVLPSLAPALAYSCGSLGTLIGADVMNLSQDAKKHNEFPSFRPSAFL